GSRRKALCLGGLNFVRADSEDVGTALGEGIDLAGVDVEAGYRELLLAIQQSERKADVSQADDADARLVLLNSSLELFQRGICGSVSRHVVFQCGALWGG